ADRSAGLVLRGHEFAVRGAAASPDGDKVVTSGLDAVTQIWSADRPADHSRVDGHVGPVTAIVPLRHRRAVLSVGHDGTLRRAELDETGDDHSVSFSALSDAKNPRNPERLHSLVVDESEENAWCGADHRIERYAISGDAAEAGAPLFLGENGPTKIAALALVPGGKLAFAGSLALSRTSRMIELVDRDNWKSFGEWTAREVTACDALATDPAGRRIVAAGQNTSVPQWIIEPGGTRVGPYPPYVGHTSYVLCLAFHPKGTQLAAGAWDGTIRLWDTGNTGQPRVIFTGHRDRVHAVDFSPDGSRLLSASADGTIRVWDPGSGHELYSLAPQAGAILAAKFTPDGDQIIAGASDGTLRIFGRKRPLVTPSLPLDNVTHATVGRDFEW
ncbi:MAG: WD40 repeat domain-containing protein, partial [Planctomycetota bacterium]|nr:WD40 repeat domain-containing protein [Planctomycetota bacterium]